MKIVGVIPARMGSSRFPGKPLVKILGMSMIEHVYRRAVMCEQLHEVYVATCDPEIHAAVTQFGGQAVMTAPTHERASDRTAEAIQSLNADLVMMVQGDEPLLHPDMLDAAISPVLSKPDLQCVNLVEPILNQADHDNPNIVKVVQDRQGNALYFSRQPIPNAQLLGFDQISAFNSVFKQTGLILFQRDFLLQYAQLEPTPLEQAESVDMLRVVEHGYKIRLVSTPFKLQPVDTLGDVKLVEDLMRHDAIIPRYLNII